VRRRDQRRTSIRPGFGDGAGIRGFPGTTCGYYVEYGDACFNCELLRPPQVSAFVARGGGSGRQKRRPAFASQSELPARKRRLCRRGEASCPQCGRQRRRVPGGERSARRRGRGRSAKLAPRCGERIGADSSSERWVRPHRIHPCLPASQSGNPVCRGVARDAGGGGDTDTNACIVGGLLGARRGRHSPADASRRTDVRYDSWAAQTEVLFDARRSFARRSVVCNRR